MTHGNQSHFDILVKEFLGTDELEKLKVKREKETTESEEGE